MGLSRLPLGHLKKNIIFCIRVPSIVRKFFMTVIVQNKFDIFLTQRQRDKETQRKTKNSSSASLCLFVSLLKKSKMFFANTLFYKTTFNLKIALSNLILIRSPLLKNFKVVNE